MSCIAVSEAWCLREDAVRRRMCNSLAFPSFQNSDRQG